MLTKQIKNKWNTRKFIIRDVLCLSYVSCARTCARECAVMCSHNALATRVRKHARALADVDVRT